MRKLNIFLFLFLTTIFLFSCYIESDSDSSNTEKSAITINIPLPDEIMKAPSGYYFEIHLIPVDGNEIYKEIDLSSFDPYNGGSGGSFPIVITDIPEGNYNFMQIEFYEPSNFNPLYSYYGNSIFTIEKGQNKIISVILMLNETPV